MKAYRLPEGSSLQGVWESQSRPALQKIESLIEEQSYFPRLLSQWSQETDAKGTLNTDISLRYGIAVIFFCLHIHSRPFQV